MSKGRVATLIDSIAAVKAVGYSGSRLYKVDGDHKLYSRIQKKHKVDHPDCVSAILMVDDQPSIVFLVPNKQINAELFPESTPPPEEAACQPSGDQSGQEAPGIL